MQIIPAIDIIEGKCVRLTEGDYAQKKIYNEDPLEVAKAFEGIGLMHLHLVDLDGAKAGEVVNWKVLEKIANNTELKIDFGGGIKTEAILKTVLDTGATYATIGSLAVKNELLFQEWIARFGAHTFMLGADVFEEKIAIGGWLEKTDISVFDFIQSYTSKGVKQIFCTDIKKDGKLQGPSTQLYQKIIEQFPTLQLIASGGVSSLDDLIELEEIGCAAAIVGKAIYENKITISELANFN
ncbi:MAG: 1-(5-phosphoribosyl)-5-[(5-phosphoribosylamino)methylideneamino]imidazole-4-carboxamide isomerase [Chitinophagia bacterium]|jgi:phosphoribosylformimino-5-aminoimidazole carboxamide ribotide isomerase|nr:1-(5-phosphoribosyl)-5-[(5-phosphoribosylamino)methylideneamino]imidazole-4-carboxamide isomerase [Chitinophagia bacterium]NCA30654.1 1-(5-phosphoribosyl)-5-[(5-phosphoribosylamino)methylideneamino]imidazole-4-carboxamide isomerase [Chitinophagia bacterium]